MAYIYKLDNNMISSSIMPLEEIYRGATVKASTNAVNIFIANSIGLGLNIGPSRMAYKHNDILFKTAKHTNGAWNITYVTRPSMQRGFVGWSGVFSANGILADLFGIQLSLDDEYTMRYNNSTLSFISPISANITYDGNILVDGQTVSGETILIDGKTITIDRDKLILILSDPQASATKIELVSPAEPYDLSYEEVDFGGMTFTEHEVIINSGSFQVDEYGHIYYTVADYDFLVSQSAIWFPGEDLEYLPNDQFSFVRNSATTADAFVEFSKDRLRSAVNDADTYNNGIINCSERVYVGYSKVYDDYVTIDYYYIIRPENTSGECGLLSDSISYGRACRVTITSTDVAIGSIDVNLLLVELNPGAPARALEIYDKVRFGTGSFKSNYKMYTYRDTRSSISVIFNRESVSKYMQLDVVDEPTRYRATLTIKNGTQTLVTTSNFARYSSNPEWSIGSTAMINVILKRSFDNISDTGETVFTNAAIALEPDSIKIFTGALYVNILDQVVNFPQQTMSYDTLAVISYVDNTEMVSLHINYQPASGAIYGRIQQGLSYDNYDRDQLVDMLNSINDAYSFSLTCNISMLSYTDLDDSTHDISFSNSTMIIAERVNGEQEEFFRVYYKNADSYGFINTKTYEITE